MEIVFDNQLLQTDYALPGDSAAAPGRIEAIITGLTNSGNSFISANPVTQDMILAVHKPELWYKISTMPQAATAALLSAGCAVQAADMAMNGSPTFALTRPPGHHAGIDYHWGFCLVNNMAIAIKHLLDTGRIRSAFIFDFDEHTGDGTKHIFAGDPRVAFYNLMGENRTVLIDLARQVLNDVPRADVLGCCAGFDGYELDVGKKYKTFDFYTLGALMKLTCRRWGHNHRFAVLEGGYYQPDLGKNAAAFTDGFA